MNRIKALLLGTLATLTLLLLPSCAVKSLIGQKAVTVRGDQTEAVAEAAQPADSGKSKKSDKKKSKATQTQNTQAVPTSLAGKLQGEWVIVGVGNQTVTREDDTPYVNFDEKDNRFYASNGCNVINGSFSLSDNEISFFSVLSTLMECPDVPFQKQISNALNEGVTVSAKVEQKGMETYLYLSNRSHAKLLTLRRHNAEAINGNWQVTSLYGEKVDNEEMNLFIDVPELKVHGNTGCNYFNGSITIDPLLPNSIAFSEMGVTQRMCPNSELERTYLVALEEAVTYKVDKDKLQFLNNKGAVVVTFKKI